MPSVMGTLARVASKSKQVIFWSKSVAKHHLPWTRSLGTSNCFQVRFTNRSEVDYLVARYRLASTNDQAGSSRLNPRADFFNKVDGDFEFKSSKVLTTEHLAKTLSISKSTARQLTSDFPSLAEHSPEELGEQCRGLVCDLNIDAQLIVACPWMLFLPLNLIRDRIEFLRQSRFSGQINRDVLVLFMLPFASFRKLLHKLVHLNCYDDMMTRMDYLTSQLKINKEEFCELVYDNTFLFTYPFERVKSITELLIDSGVEPTAIINDIHVYKHRIDKMKERIDICKQHDLPFRPWMARAPQEVFEVTLRRHLENRAILKDHSSKIEYLSSKLDCNQKIIVSLSKRYPRLLQISPKKMDNVVDYLIKKGHSPAQIIDTPKILFSNLDTVERRTEELAALNLKPTILKILTLCNEEYKRVLTTLQNVLAKGSEEKESVRNVN